MNIDPETELMDDRYEKALVECLANQGIQITSEQAIFTLGYLAAEMTIKDEEPLDTQRL